MYVRKESCVFKRRTGIRYDKKAYGGFARAGIPGRGFGYPVIGPVEDFTARVRGVRLLDGSVLEPETIEGSAVVVLRCPVKKGLFH